jgi:immune inhibitor A
MIVSFRDTAFGSGMDVTNHVTSNLTSLPSEGAKGGLLIVDSHFDPLRRTGEAATADPSVLKNLESRPQSSNAAFGLERTYPFTECMERTELDADDNPVVTEPYSEYCSDHRAQEPVRTFTDALGWYPGIEFREEGGFYRDADASVVVPSRDNQPYSTRVVDAQGNPREDLYGEDVGVATPLGTGNPEDDGVAYGTRISVLRALKHNQIGVLLVTPPAQ